VIFRRVLAFAPLIVCSLASTQTRTRHTTRQQPLFAVRRMDIAKIWCRFCLFASFIVFCQRFVLGMSPSLLRLLLCLRSGINCDFQSTHTGRKSLRKILKSNFWHLKINQLIDISNKKEQKGVKLERIDSSFSSKLLSLFSLFWHKPRV
jgi:hypothetical protein